MRAVVVVAVVAAIIYFAVDVTVPADRKTTHPAVIHSVPFLYISNVYTRSPICKLYPRTGSVTACVDVTLDGTPIRLHGLAWRNETKLLYDVTSATADK